MNPKPFRGADDVARMLALAREYPAGAIHVIDLPYRLCSWALDNPDNFALWENDAGRLLAWAVLQTPFWKLEYTLHPDAPSDAHRVILAWADRQAARLLDTPYGRPAWFTAVREEWLDRRRALAAAGWASQESGEDAWTQVIFRLDADTPVPLCRPRVGFTVRSLRGAAEVPAYVALHRAVFQSANMTEPWRAATLRQTDYRPCLDLVVEGPDGELVAFCVLWRAAVVGATAGQIEPLGVRADVRRYGVAWAIAAEGIRRLRTLGVDYVEVQTDNYRDNAYAFYQALGFRVTERLVIYRKDVDGVEG
jgi:ribosomal protein S18 acetylase RimI-like enzyme